MNPHQREMLLQQYNSLVVTKEKALIKIVPVVAVAGMGLLLHAPAVALGASSAALLETIYNKARRDAKQKKLMAK